MAGVADPLFCCCWLPCAIVSPISSDVFGVSKSHGLLESSASLLSVEGRVCRRGLVHLVLRRNKPPTSTDHQTNTPHGSIWLYCSRFMLSSHPLYQLYHMMPASSVCHPSYNNAVHIHDARFGTEMASNATCMFGMQKEVESPMTDVGNHPIPTNANLICAAISQHFAALKNNIKQPQMSLTPETF